MEKEVWLISAVCLLCKHEVGKRGKRRLPLLPGPAPNFVCCGSGQTRTWRCCGGRTRSRRTSCGGRPARYERDGWRSRRPSRALGALPHPRVPLASPTSWSRSSASTGRAHGRLLRLAAARPRAGRGREAARARRNSRESRQPGRGLPSPGCDWSPLPHSLTRLI